MIDSELKVHLNSSYNSMVNSKKFINLLLLTIITINLFNPYGKALASTSISPNTAVTAYDLIIAMNTLRVSYGLPALVEDPIIDAVAQSTAETMAASEMSWHIGNVSGRIQAAGYGGGEKVWATENFATGFHTLDAIMQVWSDPSHMIPAVNPAYCNIGAGVATSPNGKIYYVLQAAYVATKACGAYTSVGGATLQPGGTTSTGTVPQRIVPVKIATPDADGRVFHVVQAGQTLWAIAVTYKVTVKDLQTWNNLPSTTLIIGQKLLIPDSNTKGYSTPTPVGMVTTSTPDTEGKVIHIVQPYQNLISIAQAYNVTIDTLTKLNGIQIDWPLQVGQKLLISAGTITPSSTPRPLSPLEQLTPASDGKYYHIVKSGQTLSGIATLYKVSLNDLMTWNGLNTSSVLLPGQKLLLQVTPPPTNTPTTDPSTATPTASQIPDTTTSTPSITPLVATYTPTLAQPPSNGAIDSTGLVLISVCGIGLLMIVLFSRIKK